MRTPKHLVSLLLLLMALPVISKTVPQRKAISKDLFGIFIEDLNFTADGGLYAEMGQNRSFEYSPSDVDLRVYYKLGQWHNFTAWEFLKTGNAIARFSLETANPLNQNNRHYATVDVLTVGHQGAGIRNTGYHGMTVKGGDSYDFSVWLRCETIDNMPARIMLVDKDSILASAEITATGHNWKKYTATLTPKRDAENATLDIRFLHKGRIGVDMVSLFPQKTFKNRKNGLRADLAQTLADLHPAFVRFPGGCLAHGDGLSNIYRWKNTIGPVEQRVEDYNIWDYHQTKGLGYYEYLQFCEDVGAKPLPIIAAGVSCQNTARTRGTGQEAIPMDEMPQYIQDILDLIEYCNGSTTTTWGRKRAEAGHPRPFNLEYLGIGNEDRITPAFRDRFQMIVDSVRKYHPEIKIVGTAGPDPNGKDFEEGWKVARETHVALVDEHYYRAPQWFLDNFHRYDNYDRKGPKVYIGEYATRGNRWENALAEAAYLCHVERNGDVVSLASYAPLLARIGNTQWKPDLIFFDKDSVYPTVNYYVQQVFGRNHGDYYWSDVFSEGDIDKKTATSCVEDSKSGDIILKMVNTTAEPHKAVADLSAFKKLGRKAVKTLLVAPPDLTNGQGQHLKADLRPVESKQKMSKHFSYDMPPYSITVIRIGKQ